MTKIIDFAIRKAKTTLLVAFMIIIAGTCLGEQFFLILDFINLIFSS